MTVDLSTVPLVALSASTKNVISTLLNPAKIIPCENGLPRDWRGLAHLCDLSGEMMPLLTSHPDPAAHIFKVLEQKRKNMTIKDLIKILEEIDRWDILTDIYSLIECDAEKYLKELEKSQISAETVVTDTDEKILTIDDLHRLRQGLENQYYDAFLLYVDEDADFASKMVEKLENEYNLKLCLKDRDLICGITFEHEAIMTLISERCNRLIIIVSSNFLKSQANKFFLNYAQALGIDKRQRKIIPCLYEKCQLPPQLSYMFILDYNRIGLYDFWGKLRDSVQTPGSIKHEKKSINSSLLEKELSKKNAESNNSTITENYLAPSKVSNDKTQDSTMKLKGIESPANMLSNEISNKYNIYKKQNNFSVLWARKKWYRQSENSKLKCEAIKGIASPPSLPSLDGLETLSTSTNSEEKKPKKFIKKCAEKVPLKKMLLKS